MRIWVTGAGGQLGREMQRVAQETLRGETVFFTDIEQLDITNPEAVSAYAREHEIEVIVNCAAYTNVDQAEDHEASARLLNATAAGYLAAAAQAQQALLIHISTDYVFDGQSNIPYTEDAPAHPLGIYGKTKREGEQAIAASGCRSIILRTAWLYSTHGHNFVRTMHRLMQERAQIRVVFDQVGTPTYARDLAQAIAHIILARPEAEQLGLYHYTNEGVCSWYDFAEAIRAMTRKDCEIQPCHSSEYPSRVTRPPFSVLDKSKIRRVFGIQPPHWQSSLASCLADLQGIGPSS